MMDLGFLILSTLLLLHYFLHPKAGYSYNPKMVAGSNITGEGNGNPLQYSCLENPMDRRSLMGCCPWGRTESGTTEAFSMHACIGEGNGNPLQYSCLENLRDRKPGGLLSMGSHRVRHD